MNEKFQKINGMTFQSKVNAKEWIAANIPFAESSNLTVSYAKPKEACDDKWEIFQCINDEDTFEFPQDDQTDRPNRESIELTPQDAEEKADFEKIVRFMKPRIDNALSGNFSNRTIDEIFKDVEKEKKKSITSYHVNVDANWDMEESTH